MFGWKQGTPSMTEKERAVRDQAEVVVRRGLKAADAVRDAGRALSVLKGRDLWRDTATSWSAYVDSTFGISVRRAAQLIEFATVSETIDRVLTEIGTAGTETADQLTERSLRPLSGLDDDQVREAVIEAATEGDGTITAAAIRRAAGKRKKSKKARPPKSLTVRVAGCKVVLIPTHPDPVFRGYRESVAAALEKLDQQSREAA